MISRNLISMIPGLSLALLAAAASTMNTGAKPVPKARSDTLKVGDPAPALQTGNWIQGEAVKQFDRDHAYLLEFWATWCGPCRAAIPHLDELHRKFKDRGLVVIGQNVWETKETAVAAMVRKMGDKMSYRVALDDKSDGGKGRMAQTWLGAAGLRAIPATFLVDKKGEIVWIGHPMDLKDSMIEAVLAGTFNARQGVAAQEADDKARKRIQSLSSEAFAAIRAKDWGKADAAIAAAEKELPEGQRYRADIMRVTKLLAMGNHQEAARVAEKSAVDNKSNVSAQNILAAQLARTPDAAPDVLDAAQRIATHANDALAGNNISSLITLARVAFLKGDQAMAVEYQSKAVELSKPRSKARMRQFLDSYRAGHLPDAKRRRRPAHRKNN